MDSLVKKRSDAKRRAHRVRTVVVGTTERPRLPVHISNTHVYAQIIDDSRGATLAYAASVSLPKGGTLTEKAVKVGQEIAKSAQKAKIKKVVFDRGSRKYHGRLKALAEAARQAGLEF